MFAHGDQAIQADAKPADAMEHEPCPRRRVHQRRDAAGRRPGQPRTRRRWRRPQWQITGAIYAFSISLALVTLALCLKGPLRGLGPIREIIPAGAMFAVIFLLWAVADWAPVALHYRGNTVLFALEDGPLLIGLVFLSPDLLVLSAACAAAFVFTVLRRQAAMKVTFNVASSALAVAVAAIVFRELLGTHSPVSLVGWASAAAALIASQVVFPLTLKVVTLLAGQAPKKRAGILHLAIQAMLAAASMCLAFAFLDAAWFDPWTTLPLLLVAALIIVAYRGYARLSLRFSSLQHLYDFSRAMGTASLEPSSMSVDVLKEVTLSCGPGGRSSSWPSHQAFRAGSPTTTGARPASSPSPSTTRRS